MPQALQDLLDQWPVWLAVTLCLGGPAAYASGRALALHWRSFAPGFGYAALLAAAADFLAYALFGTSVIPASDLGSRLAEGDLLGAMTLLAGWAATFLLLCAIGFAGWRITRGRQMRRQYPFLMES